MVEVKKGYALDLLRKIGYTEQELWDKFSDVLRGIEVAPDSRACFIMGLVSTMVITCASETVAEEFRFLYTESEARDHMYEAFLVGMLEGTLLNIKRES